MKVVRVSKTEFELEDGSIHPIIPPLKENISIEEFQQHYDKVGQFINSIENDRSINKNP